jgi:hypothetical protein
VKKIVLIFFCFSVLYSCKKDKNTTDSSSSLAVGKSYAGGIIFYVDASGSHGLVAADQDQANAVKWAEGTYMKTSAEGVSIGAGAQNTLAIVNMLGSGNYAASICDQLQLNGYSDWFLPSKEELNLLYQQKNLVGGFTTNYYWSSTEHSISEAWYLYFPYGPQFYTKKDSLAAVRAIRAF